MYLRSLFQTTLVLSELLSCVTHASPQTAVSGNTIDFSLTVSSQHFSDFKNASTLQKYLQSHGYNQPLPYRQMAHDIKKVLDPATPFAIGPEVDSPFDSSPIKTHSNSTTLKGGPSYSNVTAQSYRGRIKAISFSDGNSASSGGSIQRTTTISSDASSGRANSTDRVTGTSSEVRINVTASALDAGSINEVVNGGAKDALSASVCAAEGNGASAHAKYNETYHFPINKDAKTTNESLSMTFCEAGVDALKNSSLPNSLAIPDAKTGSTSAAVAGSNLFMTNVTCAGETKLGQDIETQYVLTMLGQSTSQYDFSGRMTVKKVVTSHVQCHVMSGS